MVPFMLSKAELIGKFFPAFLAGECFRTVNVFDVFPKRAVEGVISAAVMTHELLLFTMVGDFMTRDLDSLVKSFVTLIAWKWSFLRMLPLVLHQCIRLCKRFLANVAFERSVSCMVPHMNN